MSRGGCQTPEGVKALLQQWWSVCLVFKRLPWNTKVGEEILFFKVHGEYIDYLFGSISMTFHCPCFLFALLCECEQRSWCKNDGNFQRAEVLTFLLQVSLFSDLGRKKKFLSSFLNLSRLFLSAFLKSLQRWN